MNHKETLRGKGGVKTRIFNDRTNSFFVEITGKRPEPRIYRDSNGTVYGIERFKASRSARVPMSCVSDIKGAREQAEMLLRAVESMPAPAPPTPPLPEPDSSAWVNAVLSSPPPLPPEIEELFN